MLQVGCLSASQSKLETESIFTNREMLELIMAVHTMEYCAGILK